MGARHEKAVSETVHTSSSCLGSLLCGTFHFLRYPSCQTAPDPLMGTPDNVLGAGSAVRRVLPLLEMPATMLYNSGAAIPLQGIPRDPVFSVCAGVTVVLTQIFAICFHMGVAGVATATVISCARSALLVLRQSIHDRML